MCFPHRPAPAASFPAENIASYRVRPKTGRWAARLERKSSRGRGGAASSTRWGPQEAPPFKIWQPPPWVLAVCSSNLWDFAPMFCQSLSWVISDRREQSGVWAGMAPQLVAVFLLALSPPKRTLLEAPFSHVLLYRGPWRRRGRKATIRRMKAEPCPNTFPSVGLSPALGQVPEPSAPRCAHRILQLCPGPASRGTTRPPRPHPRPHPARRKHWNNPAPFSPHLPAASSAAAWLSPLAAARRGAALLRA